MTRLAFCPNRHSASTRAYPGVPPGGERCAPPEAARAQVSPRSRRPDLAGAGQPGARAVGPDQHGWSHDQAVAGRAPGEAGQQVAVPAPGDPGLYGYQISTAFTADSTLVARSDAATLVFIFFRGHRGRRAR